MEEEIKPKVTETINSLSKNYVKLKKYQRTKRKSLAHFSKVYSSVTLIVFKFIRFPACISESESPTKKELLAANKTNDEICKYIGAKSLSFLSIDGLYKAIGFENRSKIYPQLTDHYFTGDYPVKLVDELGDNKITQLSLLSSASNN